MSIGAGQMSIGTYLKQRYPYNENKWKFIIPISFFVAFFMVIFQPFGLSELQGQYRTFILAGYGLVTFIVLVIDLWLVPALFPRNFREEKWKVYKELLFLVFILFTVGLANFLYSSWLIGFRLTMGNILTFQAYTLAVGIIPVTAITLFKQNYLNRKYREDAENISSGMKIRSAGDDMSRRVRISSENEKEGVEILLQDLVYVKSDGNYITVGHLKNGKPATILLRNTLKYTVDLLEPYPSIFQCHRSWLVNLNLISKVNGNSQGLRLHMVGFEEDIPVARNNAAIFRQLVTKN